MIAWFFFVRILSGPGINPIARAASQLTLSSSNSSNKRSTFAIAVGCPRTRRAFDTCRNGMMRMPDCFTSIKPTHVNVVIAFRRASAATVASAIRACQKAAMFADKNVSSSEVKRLLEYLPPWAAKSKSAYCLHVDSIWRKSDASRRLAGARSQRCRRSIEGGYSAGLSRRGRGVIPAKRGDYQECRCYQAWSTILPYVVQRPQRQRAPPSSSGKWRHQAENRIS